MTWAEMRLLTLHLSLTHLAAAAAAEQCCQKKERHCCQLSLHCRLVQFLVHQLCLHCHSVADCAVNPEQEVQLSQTDVATDAEVQLVRQMQGGKPAVQQLLVHPLLWPAVIPAVIHTKAVLT